MKKYYFTCEFDEAIYSNITKRNEKSYLIVGDTGSTLRDMREYIQSYITKENFTLSGKNKGDIYRNDVKVGKFSLSSNVII